MVYRTHKHAKSVTMPVREIIMAISCRESLSRFFSLQTDPLLLVFSLSTQSDTLSLVFSPAWLRSAVSAHGNGLSCPAPPYSARRAGLPFC